MSSGQETEAKFHVRDLKKIEARLQALGARLIQTRVHETNLRFDTPASELRGNKKVLRLRQDEKARMTFKGPSAQRERGMVSREEIEFVVEDFDRAKKFLEALGYQAVVFYEKFRATYELQGAHIMLDELPYGTFVEIEGEDIEVIHSLAQQIGLKWETMIKAGYHAIYDMFAEKCGLDKADLSFKQLRETKIEMTELGFSAADE